MEKNIFLILKAVFFVLFPRASSFKIRLAEKYGVKDSISGQTLLPYGAALDVCRRLGLWMGKHDCNRLRRRYVAIAFLRYAVVKYAGGMVEETGPEKEKKFIKPSDVSEFRYDKFMSRFGLVEHDARHIASFLKLGQSPEKTEAAFECLYYRKKWLHTSSDICQTPGLSAGARH
jgi:hypothetical protein